MPIASRCSKIISFACAALFAGGAIAGPFGLDQGTSLSSLKAYGAEPTKSDGIYQLKKVPNPHPMFNDYSVAATPQDGVCKILAFSVSIKTSVYGSELKDKFDEIHDSLNAKYGKAEDLDELREGSIWNEPKDWMTALHKKERLLQSLWSKDLPDGIDAISLEAIAYDRDEGMLFLGYQFKNFDTCRARMKEKEDKAL